jgi:hypothetical protein
MNNCYLCGVVLTKENGSKEHIILNSIGGRLKSNKLLCKTCNSDFGHTADSELAHQLSFWASFLQVKRENGQHPIIKGGKTEGGKEYHLKDGTTPVLPKPKFERNIENGEVKYQIEARNEKELIDMLTGLRKKHPELDVEAAKQYFRWNEEYLDEPLSYQTTIGGELAFKSIVKSAVNYYIFSKNETENVKHLFDYLKGTSVVKVCGHYHASKPAYQKESNEIIHLIHLVGDKSTKLLYCFVEFFSAYSFMVILSENYTSKNFSSTYCYNLITNKEVAKSVKLKIRKDKIKDIITPTIDHLPIVRSKLNRIMRIAMKSQNEQQINKIVRKSIERVFERHKEEKFITEQMINEFSEDVAQSYVKFAFRGQYAKKGA